MKKKLIVNADDFGLSPGVNKGIVEAYLNGILSSTTLMVNQPYAEHAVELYQNYSNLGLGIHLTFDKGKSLFGVSSLTDSEGNFKRYKLLLESGRKEDFIREIEAQIFRFEELCGKMPTHMDSHHHIHIRIKEAFEAIQVISKKYNLKYRKNDELIGEFYEDNVSLSNFYSLIDTKDTEVIEFMCHPAIVDTTLLETSSYSYKREEELKILTSSEVKNYVKDRYILMSYDGKIKNDVNY
ncbi:MAG: carbohydrate deacetylase [Cetobacterium sp.]|uniref:carbohydrate deacetylase n=1 Tax=Cetobacterium sp. TaxID=2071632 RepID=UPI0025E9E1AA|nr:carbohydrate deacetylase [uncultured Cetobacterium sp.]